VRRSTVLRTVAYGSVLSFAVDGLWAAEPPKKLPVPDAAAQAEATKLVREIFGSDYNRPDLTRSRLTPRRTWQRASTSVS
jgi:hypothetical protein